jgi:hypothetical protein
MPLKIAASLFAALLLLVIAGCGDSDTETVTVTASAEETADDADSGGAEDAEDAGGAEDSDDSGEAEDSDDAGAPESAEGDADASDAAAQAAVESLRGKAPASKDPGGAGTAAPASFRAIHCGSGVYVKTATTSCAFAFNVAADFFSSPGYRFYSYSPATGQTYFVKCSKSFPTLCKAGNGAKIFIT